MSGALTLIVSLDMKVCFCNFVKWQIHHFISKGTFRPHKLLATILNQFKLRPKTVISIYEKCVKLDYLIQFSPAAFFITFCGILFAFDVC